MEVLPKGGKREAMEDKVFMSSQWWITWRRVWLAFYLLTGLSGMNGDWWAAESWHGVVYLARVQRATEKKIKRWAAKATVSTHTHLTLTLRGYLKETDSPPRSRHSATFFEMKPVYEYHLLFWDNSSLLTLRACERLSDVHLWCNNPKSMHGNDIDLLHLVPPCTGIISAAVKLPHRLHLLGSRSPWGGGVSPWRDREREREKNTNNEITWKELTTGNRLDYTCDFQMYTAGRTHILEHLQLLYSEPEITQR